MKYVLTDEIGKSFEFEANEQQIRQIVRTIRGFSCEDKFSELFNQFWAVYPRKKAKPRALAEFKKLQPTAELTAVIIAAVERDKNSKGWRADGGIYIPYPAKYLKERYFEDNAEAVVSYSDSARYEQNGW